MTEQSLVAPLPEGEQEVGDLYQSHVDGRKQSCFIIAAKHQIDPNAFFSAKVNNSSLVGLGYTQTLKRGVKQMLPALLDSKNVNASGHKLEWIIA
ncbi:hypothetical protein HPG69_007892 [Diceros bicornis minor]|uniref:Non-selective voltage-gated ion channel VDAC1 n=1 Tax=Diceros bicornis minor TaxID=77932 RepID=A0A7J7EAY0_DICBM|nr:hypothetical protein HPG69_007892 [Diceros bicornis minor]